MSAAPSAPYSVLAAGYDAVMAHVDYPFWAGFVRDLLARHAPHAQSVVELGAGTGSLALALQPLGPPPDGFAYRAFDGSAAMVAVARATVDVPATFDVLDFRAPVPGPPADAVLLLYDGLNYLTEPSDVAALLASVRGALAPAADGRPGGVAVIDSSTPANSINHADAFDDEGVTDAFAFRRTSLYDEATRLHTTTFEIQTPDGTVHVERHVQRAWSMAELRALAAAAGLREVAAYDDFTTEPATDRTERVHWVWARADDASPGDAE